MFGHTNNAALNEAAQREHERLRKDAEDRMADKLNKNLPSALQARITELEELIEWRDRMLDELNWERRLYRKQRDKMATIARHFKNLIAELEAELAVRDRAMEILAECHNPVYCPFPEDEHTPCVKCTLKQYSKNYQKFRVDAALAQARAELEPKLEAKP